MARRTSLGTGVGPGAINWYFFIGPPPWNPRDARARATASRSYSRRDAACQAGERRRRSRRRASERDDEDRVQVVAGRGEELDHLAVVEGEPRRAEALRVRGQVRAPAREPSLEVGQPIATV